MYYFDTKEQILADEAFNKEDYQTALKHYKTALTNLNRQIAAERKPTKVLPYPVAYVLVEICLTLAEILANLDYEKPIAAKIDGLLADFTQHFSEVSQLMATSPLRKDHERDLSQKLQTAKTVVYDSAQISSWNRADFLTSENLVLSEQFEALEEALSELERCRTFINILCQTDNKERKKDIIQICEKEAEIHEKLSDLYVDLANDSTPNERFIQGNATSIYYFEQALSENQKSLKIQLNLQPRKVPIHLHLDYLNIQALLFKFSKKQEYLLEITRYIHVYQLNSINGDNDQNMELKIFQFLVANESNPRRLQEANTLAKEIIKYDEIQENEDLQKGYEAAKDFLSNPNNKLYYTTQYAKNLMFQTSSEQKSEETGDYMELCNDL
ncbi:MAG: hypothetical protein WC627_11590 [Legionella sp.]